MGQAMAIEDRIQDFMLRHFRFVRKNGIRGGEKWLESGILDSLGVLELVHFLEEEFAIQISDEELIPENFGSLEAVSAFVRGKKGEKAPATPGQSPTAASPPDRRP